MAKLCATKKNKNLIKLLPICIFIGLLFFLWRGLYLDPHALPSTRINEPLPSFELPLLGESGNLKSETLKGQFSLLNIWASWCDSCVEEQSFLVKLAQSGVAITGINYKDEAHRAEIWLKTWGNPYHKIGQDETGRIASELGVYGTPETFLISPQGIIIYRFAGVLTSSVWKQEFLPRMKGVNIDG